MKLTAQLTGILLLFNITASFGNFFSEYFENRYYVNVTEDLPEGISDVIFIISTRHFRPENNYRIERGVDTHYRRYCFIAGLKNDTAYIKPLKDFQEVVQFLPENRDFLVYVDGHGKTFGQTLERGFELTHRFNINMIVFDWPSDYLAIRKTIYNASEVSAGFVESMQQVESLHKAYYKSSSFSVIFHSMGNHILENISRSTMLEKMPQRLFTNIIMNAPSVKRYNHKKWVEKLNIQKRIYITMNEHDFNLRGAAILTVAHQLGLGNKNNAAGNAYYVNFSDIATVDHNLFLGKSQLEDTYPEIYSFYEMAFHGKEFIGSEDMGFQILSPSDKSFLFSVK